MNAHQNSSEDRAARREREIKALLEASRAVLEQNDFAETARAIFDHACDVTGASSGYIALLTPDGRENEVLFLESGGATCTVDPDLPMPIRGLREVAYRECRTVFDNHFSESDWNDFLPAGHVRLKNVMFAPLIINERAQGLMGLANKPNDFTERDVEMAAALGEFAALALKNARNLDRLNSTINKLEKTLREVKTLRGIVPICSKCKKIRDEDGYWREVDAYVSEHSEGDFSHGICAECMDELYGDYLEKD